MPFIEGNTYFKTDIYEILEVPKEKQRGEWDKGYRNYLGDFFIFCNIGVAGRTGHDYDNYWKDGLFYWQGSTQSKISNNQIQAMINKSPDTKIFLFTRTQDRLPFTFSGQIRAKEAFDEVPVRIIWEHDRKPVGKNPKWHRDEIILALDLYYELNKKNITSSNQKIIELSKLLNNLPLFTERPDEKKFRNPNGIILKLTNFLSIDPTYSGKGMAGGSKLDKEVFEEFLDNRSRLRFLADELKGVLQDPQIQNPKVSLDKIEINQNFGVIEGQILYRLHKTRERDPRIVKVKKSEAFRKFGKLACEACTFDFLDFYGEIGNSFIECHHRIPLSKINVNVEIYAEDLALVCSNCHRMLHKKVETLSVEGLRLIISDHNQKGGSPYLDER